MRVELDSKKIKSSDLEALYKDISCGEIYEAANLSKILNKYIKGDWGSGTEYIKMVYMFRLGLIMGKREERAKRLASERRQ